MQVFYKVRQGDTLSSIAARWNIPLNSLILANNLSAPYTIFPGQQLSMPPAVNTYVVKRGDTLYSISQKYGVPFMRIAEANSIGEPFIITTGQVLIIPEGVPYYTVRSGDTLYRLAAKYNVTVGGQPRPDLIIKANPGLTADIEPGMNIAIPHPPPGGTGKLAVLVFDDLNYYLGLYDPANGNTDEIKIDKVGRSSAVFWAPDRRKVAYTNDSGVISIVDTATKRISKIDQTVLPSFIDWSADSSRVLYTTGQAVRIYNVNNNTSVTINRPNASYPQWFPREAEILFESEDAMGKSQLFRMNSDGSNVRQITRDNTIPKHEVKLSPDGRHVLYTSPGASISIIYSYEFASGKTFTVPGGPEAKNYNPQWSPDSSMIAYSATQFINGRYYSQIRVSGPKGENDRLLAYASCFSTPVSWSPDSKKIAYLTTCRDDVPPVELWTIDVTRPVPMNAMFGLFFFNMDWTPTRN